VENGNAYLNDISGTAFLVNVDYFTSPIPFDEFNAVKQRVNLDVLRLLAELDISIAGSSTTISLQTASPPEPDTSAANPPSAAAGSTPAKH
jgi:hypothetical protein